MNRTLRVAAISSAALVLVASICMCVMTARFTSSDRICQSVRVSSVDVGGMTKTQARNAVKKWADQRLARRITLTALDSRWSGALRDFGASIKVDKAIGKAFAIGRTGNIIQRAICILPFTHTGKYVSAPIVLDDRLLDKVIGKICRAIDRPHQDAKLVLVNDRLDIAQDGCGIKVSRVSARSLLVRSLSSGRLVISLPVEVDNPDVTADQLIGIDTLLASYTTPFNPGKLGRTHNLTLAARSISGIVIKPGEVFSYNTLVGPRLTSRGFQNAQIFIKGKLEPGVGGGVCQISSTLYNAALLVGLKIIKRSHHSQVVPYVSPGRDATVAYGLLDLKFQNTNSSPIGMVCQVGRSKVTLSIFGSAGDKKIVRVFTTKPNHTAAGLKTVVDATLAEGARKVVEKGVRGVSVTVYREMVAPDGSKTTEVVSRDRYPSLSAIVAIGVAAPAQTSTVE